MLEDWPAKTNRTLAERKGSTATIPYHGIWIDTLALQEAKATTGIEDISPPKKRRWKRICYSTNRGQLRPNKSPSTARPSS